MPSQRQKKEASIKVSTYLAVIADLVIDNELSAEWVGRELQYSMAKVSLNHDTMELLDEAVAHAFQLYTRRHKGQNLT